jgi:hypothetical protein
VSHTIELPVNLHDRMSAGFVKNAARDLVYRRSEEPDGILVHGDDIGSFLGWWWQSDAETGLRFLGDYVAEVRRADPLRREAPLDLDTILYALPSALSIRLSGDETDAFLGRAREELT